MIEDPYFLHHKRFVHKRSHQHRTCRQNHINNQHSAVGDHDKIACILLNHGVEYFR